MAKIGLYGGSFNPPHIGHVQAAKAAGAALALDEICFMPARTAPHKPPDRRAPSHAERLAMLSLAAAQCPRAYVSDRELARQGKSYTADTLRALHAERPRDEIYFLCGSDMFVTLKDWHDAAEICRIAHLAVFMRGEKADSRLAEAGALLADRFACRYHFVPLAPCKVSSTELRGLLPKGEGADLLPKGLFAYIKEHSLYLGADRFDAVARDMQSTLSAKRLAHTMGTVHTAEDLALFYGENAEKAAFAALVHDCTKELSLKEHLQLCAEYDILLDTLQEKSPSLLHGITAAALARQKYHLGDEIALAVRYHTTARAAMTGLEKILFLADYIEPGRTHCDELLRRLCYEDLDRAMARAACLTAADVAQKGETLHPDTAAAEAFYGTPQ